MNTTDVSILTNLTTMVFEISSVINETFLNSSLSRAPGSARTISSSHGWMLNLSFGLSCFFLAFGLFGNIITLIIIARSANRSKPYNILIMLLATADTTSMLSRMLNSLGPIQMNLITITNYVTCLILDLTATMGRYTSTVTVEVICIERFLVILFPLKSKRWLTTKNACISVAACLLSTMVSSIVFTVYSDDCRRDSTRNRSTASGSTEVAQLRLVSVALYQYIPMAVLLSLTPVMIFKLFKQHTIRRRLTKTESKTGHFQISVLLMAIVIAYTVLEVVPNLVLFALAASGIAIHGRNASLTTMFFKLVLQPVGHMMNYSTNFIFYNTFNADFRHKTLILLGCSRRRDQTVKKDQNESNPANNVSSL